VIGKRGADQRLVRRRYCSIVLVGVDFLVAVVVFGDLDAGPAERRQAVMDTVPALESGTPETAPA